MKIIISALICILVISCQTINTDNENTSDEKIKKTEEENIIPILIHEYDTKKNERYPSKANYYAINSIDFSISDSCSIKDFRGWGNSFGLPSTDGNSCYFLSSINNLILKLQKKNGELLSKTQVNSVPGLLSQQMSPEGIFLVNHALIETDGFRVTIFDSHNDSILTHSVFIPENLWSYTLYDTLNNCFYLSVPTKDSLGEPFDILYELNLSDYKLKKIFTTPKIQTISGLAIINNLLYMGINNLMARDSTADKWINNNQPYCFEYNINTKKVSLLRVPCKSNTHYIKTLFSWNDNLYVLLGENSIGLKSWKQWLLKYDKKKKVFTQCRKKPYLNLYSGTLPFFEKNSVIFSYPDENSIIFQKINLLEYSFIEKTVFLKMNEL